jgi:hypothetical protein
MRDVAKFLLGKFQSVGIGVLAAVVTVLLLDRWRDEPKPLKADVNQLQVEETTRVVQSVVLDRGAHARIEQLELQLRDMQKAEAATEENVEQEELSPDESRRLVENSYAELDGVHQRDSRDPEWAGKATTDLASGLTALGEKLGFTLDGADCKTTTCKATVGWKDYSTARGSFAQLAEQVFGDLKCEQHVRLSEPTEPNGPAESLLYLDCTELRAGMAAGTSLN